MGDPLSPARSASLHILSAGVRLAASDLRLRFAGADPSARRREAGRRIAAALGGLRGIYTKLGQLLAMRADLLPDEAREELSALLDAATPVPFPELRPALERALGPLDRSFRSIDPVPLGTASIAQVHRARLRDGTPVAVKVRHPTLTPERLERDLRTLRRAARLAGRLGGGPALAPLAEEAGDLLRAELDLAREGRAADEIAGDLADDPRVVVPRVHWGSTTAAVLTLDYVPRVPLDSPDALARAGVRPEECLSILARAYGRQLFAHGRFHADPHPGNVYLVDEADGLAPPGEARPRILFVDFGLSQRLPAALRLELRLGLHALLRRDVPALLASLERAGALTPGRKEAAAAALHDALRAGAAEALGAQPAAIISLVDLGKRLVRESGAFRIPRELLLFARTLAALFALAERIAPGTDAMRELVPELIRFLAEPGTPVSAAAASAATRSGE